MRCSSVRQKYVNSSATEAADTSSAITRSRPTATAAAPSPRTGSSSDSGSASRASAAATSTFRRLLAPTPSSAARSAATPARTDPPKSATAVVRGRSAAVATTLATCFSR
ncbi:MAG: hypothetical protein E6J70_17980 [Deltaproteobacteria bacterium]|nr:MAG: hypothetical protein E6J70_17980 [Deltaproteobacteria bacterium]